MTNAALVAKIIRAELKKHGIAGRVKSSNYTGGSSVDVYVSDQLPATVQKIKEFCSDYKAGYFDGQTDMYVYQHNDNPTVSFICFPVTIQVAKLKGDRIECIKVACDAWDD